MWAEASRSIWMPGVPNMELLDLNVCPDGFQSCFAPHTPLFVPFLSFKRWKYLLHDIVCWEYLTCYSALGLKQSLP